MTQTISKTAALKKLRAIIQTADPSLMTAQLHQVLMEALVHPDLSPGASNYILDAVIDAPRSRARLISKLAEGAEEKPDLLKRALAKPEFKADLIARCEDGKISGRDYKPLAKAVPELASNDYIDEIIYRSQPGKAVWWIDLVSAVPDLGTNGQLDMLIQQHLDNNCNGLSPAEFEFMLETRNDLGTEQQLDKFITDKHHTRYIASKFYAICQLRPQWLSMDRLRKFTKSPDVLGELVRYAPEILDLIVKHKINITPVEFFNDVIYAAAESNPQAIYLHVVEIADSLTQHPKLLSLLDSALCGQLGTYIQLRTAGSIASLQEQMEGQVADLQRQIAGRPSADWLDKTSPRRAGSYTSSEMDAVIHALVAEVPALPPIRSKTAAVPVIAV